MTDDQFQVHGTITDDNGCALPHAEVFVWQQRIRDRRCLKECRTDRHGKYRLEFQRPIDECGRPLIVISARTSDGHEPLESSVLEAQDDLRVDLAADPRDASEYATLIRAIAPHLDGLDLVDVVESDEHRDITFIARKLNRTPRQIARAALAARLAMAFELPAPIFYAFLAQQVPPSLPQPLLDATQGFSLIYPVVQRIGSLVFALSPDTQTQTLQRAVDGAIIGGDYRQRIPEIVSQLQARRMADALQQPYQRGQATLAQLLDAAQLPTSKQAEFAKALVTNMRPMPEFWSTLGESQKGFTREEVSAVKQVLDLGALVDNHIRLIESLLQRFADGDLQSLSGLARLRLQDWTDLVHKTGIPDKADNTGAAVGEEEFAKGIYRRVIRAYPSAALAARMSTADFVPASMRDPATRFFANNPSLELRTLNIPVYLEQTGDTAFAGIEVNDRPAVIDIARRFQRVLRITSNVDTAQTLLGLGIHSATQIYTMGKHQFVAKAVASGLSSDDATAVHDVAKSRYAGVVALFSQFNRGFIKHNTGRAFTRFRGR